MAEGSAQRGIGGRRAEAAANDERILRVALLVLIADPRAPISTIADEAGVGIASLYRRFKNRDELVRRISLHAMSQITAEADTHRERLVSSPWKVFVDFIAAAMAVGAGSMETFAGTFDPGEELNRAGQDLYEAIAKLVAEAQRLEAVRDDIGPLDLFQIFHMLRSVRVGTAERDTALRRRYIDLLLPSLRAGRSEPLTEPAPSWEEQLSVWNR
jgi:AcrR family transcriptional regulator